MQVSRGPFCKCESWCALSQNLPALGCEAKGQLVASDWQLGCPGRWDKWVSGRRRQVSTAERGEVSTLWTGLSSPPSTLLKLQSCLTFWSSDGPRVPHILTWTPDLVPLKIIHTTEPQNPGTEPARSSADCLQGWRWQWLWIGEVFEVFKEEVRLLLVVLPCFSFYCMSTLLALLCFPNLLMIVVQLLSHVWHFATPRTAVHQASLSFTVSQSLLKLISIGGWCHATISSSVIPFSSCLQSFPASGSFPMSRLFTLGGQSIGASASASVLPVNIQDWFHWELTGLISLHSKGLWRVFSNTTV